MTFVLVHGGFHGGWCWNAVARLMRRAGAEIWTPTLTGLGDRRHLFSDQITPATHVEDIAGLLFFEDLTDVTLVGHSYAGMIISAVAERCPERLARLVYLDAQVPGEGGWPHGMITPEQRGDLATFACSDDRMLPPPPSALGLTSDDTAHVAARLVPQPLRTFLDPLPLGPLPDLDRHYIDCTGQYFAMLDDSRSRARGPGWTYHQIAAGHDVMIEDPAALSALLLTIAS